MEILFRGKRLDNGEWVYGNLIECSITGKKYIFPTGSDANESSKIYEEGCLRIVTFEIISETVGQYTGLKDKNGVKIYQDDIVRHGSIKKGNTYVIAWDGGSGSFYYKPSDSKGYGGLRMFINPRGLTPYEVLGTTHDNPELLEVQK